MHNSKEKNNKEYINERKAVKKNYEKNAKGARKTSYKCCIPKIEK